MQLLIPCVIVIECFPHPVMSSVVEMTTWGWESKKSY